MADLDRLRVKIDGDQMCFTLDDFVDLQSSPSYFLPLDSWQGRMLGPWVGVTKHVYHLPSVELLGIVRALIEKED